MTHFEFATAGRIIFGPGSMREVAGISARWGKRALVVTGRSRERVEALLGQLEAKGTAAALFHVPGEPTIETVQSCVRHARQSGCEFVIGFGGGSAIDTAKAAAAILANEGDLLDYLEVIGKGRTLANPSLPFLAIPTTAGTGAEVTRNAVLASVEHRVKVSLRSHFMLPRLAVVDPELTYPLPPFLTATTGLDALTQLIEPFVSNSSSPLTDALCREGILRVARSLQRACSHGNDAQAREDMSLASLFGGLALANAKLGAVHGLAGPLGGVLPAPHGALCARLLPVVMNANIRALRERAPGSPVLERYSEVARLLTGKEGARHSDGVSRLNALCSELAIPALSAYGLGQNMIPAVVEQAMKASSMKGNPIELTGPELTSALEQAMDAEGA
ncbi:MAG: iron-containing alcohol dehydrogenase [Syntrophobacteraceae bacterium]